MDTMTRLNDDMKTAMKEKDALKLSVIRMVKAAAQLVQIEKKSPLDENEVLTVLRKEARKRQDSIEEFKKGNREEDLAAKEEAELKIIESYLPQLMGEPDIRAAVVRIRAAMPDADKGNVGKVMKAVMAELKGKADGALVKTVVSGEIGNP